MLKELYIRDYALFGEIRVGLGPNFNVFTGEVGAGKSLLVGAIGLLLGDKGDSIMIRKGCREAEVIGLLSIEPGNGEALAWLESCEIQLEQEPPAQTIDFSVRRILKDTGRSSCYIQHVPVTRGKLAELMSLLFDLHGQHQNQSLFHGRQQLRMLDHYAQLGQQVEEFSQNFHDINQKKQQLLEAEAAVEQKREHAAYLRKAIEEITALQPQKDEDVQLSEQIDLLSEAENMRERLEQIMAEGSQALDRLNQAHSQLHSLATRLIAVKGLPPRLQSACIEIEDILESCAAEKNNLELNPSQLQELDQRLSQLILLSRKYGHSSLNETIQFAREAERDLLALEGDEDSIVAQKEEVQAAEKQLMQEAQYLSQQRRKHAKLLQQSIEDHLRNLGMTHARFQIELSLRGNDDGHVLCHSYGIDKVRFLLAANPGEDFRPIQQVASGGEISRIMLAIKSESVAPESPFAMQNKGESSIETIIFDEIDTGIGGETGIRLAQYIHHLGRRKQVLCVTHLASVAASANCHMKIEKVSNAGNTSVNIYNLSGEERPAELARMLSGDAKNAASLAHAEELLSRYSL